MTAWFHRRTGTRTTRFTTVRISSRIHRGCPKRTAVRITGIPTPLVTLRLRRRLPWWQTGFGIQNVQEVRRCLTFKAATTMTTRRNQHQTTDTQRITRSTRNHLRCRPAIAAVPDPHNILARPVAQHADQKIHNRSSRRLFVHTPDTPSANPATPDRNRKQPKLEAPH